MLSLAAVSVSRSVRRACVVAPLPLRVLAVFGNVVDLVADDGQVVAVVTRNVGDGPLNIVIDAHLRRLPIPPAGTLAWMDGSRLVLGQIEIRLECPEWEPRPNWEYLRTCRLSMLTLTPDVLRIALRTAPSAGLLALLEPDLAVLTSDRQLDPFRSALADLDRVDMWTPLALNRLAARVAGLGWGLTPAGDDWLAGLLTCAWVVHPSPLEVAEAVLSVAVPRTSRLSAAFLRSAAYGECDAAWHSFLCTLASGDRQGLEEAVRSVLAHGATSGADRLAGFLHALVHWPRRREAASSDASVHHVEWPIHEDSRSAPQRSIRTCAGQRRRRRSPSSRSVYTCPHGGRHGSR